MSVSKIIIVVVGVILAIVGLGLILAAVGVPIIGAGLSPWWLGILVGLLLLGAGIWIVKGGSITA